MTLRHKVELKIRGVKTKVKRREALILKYFSPAITASTKIQYKRVLGRSPDLLYKLSILLLISNDLIIDLNTIIYNQ